MKQSIGELKANFPGTGRIEWIGVRPARKAPMISCQREYLIPGQGLQGDRFKGQVNSRRQVSLIQAEHIAAIASMSGLETLTPDIFRRNIVVSGINLLALKNTRFKLGAALLEMTCLCHPCSRMEESLGIGGYNIMRGHGGILAKVITGGEILVGDKLQFVTSCDEISASNQRG